MNYFSCRCEPLHYNGTMGIVSEKRYTAAFTTTVAYSGCASAHLLCQQKCLSYRELLFYYKPLLRKEPVWKCLIRTAFTVFYGEVSNKKPRTYTIRKENIALLEPWTGKWEVHSVFSDVTLTPDTLLDCRAPLGSAYLCTGWMFCAPSVYLLSKSESCHSNSLI